MTCSAPVSTTRRPARSVPGPPLRTSQNPQSMGGYAYSDDDPVNGTDPTGQCPCLTDGGTEQKNPDTGVYGGGGGGETDPYPVTDPGTSGGDPIVSVSPHVSVERKRSAPA